MRQNKYQPFNSIAVQSLASELWFNEGFSHQLVAVCVGYKSSTKLIQHNVHPYYILL